MQNQKFQDPKYHPQVHVIKYPEDNLNIFFFGSVAYDISTMVEDVAELDIVACIQDFLSCIEKNLTRVCYINNIMIDNVRNKDDHKQYYTLK